jgi:hypothetical protein
MWHSKALIAGLSVSLAGAVVFVATARGDDDDKAKVAPPKATGKPEDKGARIPPRSDTVLTTSTGTRTEASGYERIIAGWEERPREIAEATVAEYGEPTEVSASRLVWRGNGPWKETIVHRDGLIHDFPKPHTDVIEQVIDYRVPTDKADDLLAFDGSLTIHRTEGTLSARCDDEALNFLALNLANEIVEGDKSSDQARKAYAQGVVDLMKKKSPAATEKLLFDVSSTATTDPDKPFKLRIR